MEPQRSLLPSTTTSTSTSTITTATSSTTESSPFPSAMAPPPAAPAPPPRSQRSAPSTSSSSIRTVYIKNLSPTVDSVFLKITCSPYGDVSNVKVIREADGVSKRFAFVTFKQPEQAQKAISMLNGKELDGRILFAGPAIKKAARHHHLQQQQQQHQQQQQQSQHLQEQQQHHISNLQLHQMSNQSQDAHSHSMCPNRKSREFQGLNYPQIMSPKRKRRAISEGKTPVDEGGVTVDESTAGHSVDQGQNLQQTHPMACRMYSTDCVNMQNTRLERNYNKQLPREPACQDVPVPQSCSNPNHNRSIQNMRHISESPCKSQVTSNDGQTPLADTISSTSENIHVMESFISSSNSSHHNFFLPHVAASQPPSTDLREGLHLPEIQPRYLQHYDQHHPLQPPHRHQKQHSIPKNKDITCDSGKRLYPRKLEVFPFKPPDIDGDHTCTSVLPQISDGRESSVSQRQYRQEDRQPLNRKRRRACSAQPSQASQEGGGKYQCIKRNPRLCLNEISDVQPLPYNKPARPTGYPRNDMNRPSIGKETCGPKIPEDGQGRELGWIRRQETLPGQRQPQLVLQKDNQYTVQRNTALHSTGGNFKASDSEGIQVATCRTFGDDEPQIPGHGNIYLEDHQHQHQQAQDWVSVEQQQQGYHYCYHQPSQLQKQSPQQNFSFKDQTNQPARDSLTLTDRFSQPQLSQIVPFSSTKFDEAVSSPQSILLASKESSQQKHLAMMPSSTFQEIGQSSKVFPSPGLEIDTSPALPDANICPTLCDVKSCPTHNACVINQVLHGVKTSLPLPETKRSAHCPESVHSSCPTRKDIDQPLQPTSAYNIDTHQNSQSPPLTQYVDPAPSEDTDDRLACCKCSACGACKEDQSFGCNETIQDTFPPNGAAPQGINLYVKHLDENVDDIGLKDMFSKFGEVISAKVMMEGDRSRGFGFVCFLRAEDAARATRDMRRNVDDVNKRHLYVAPAQRKEERQAFFREKLKAKRRDIPSSGGTSKMAPPRDSHPNANSAQNITNSGEPFGRWAPTLPKSSLNFFKSSESGPNCFSGANRKDNSTKLPFVAPARTVALNPIPSCKRKIQMLLSRRKKANISNFDCFNMEKLRTPLIKPTRVSLQSTCDDYTTDNFKDRSDKNNGDESATFKQNIALSEVHGSDLESCGSPSSTVVEPDIPQWGSPHAEEERPQFLQLDGSPQTSDFPCASLHSQDTALPKLAPIGCSLRTLSPTKHENEASSCNVWSDAAWPENAVQDEVKLTERAKSPGNNKDAGHECTSLGNPLYVTESSSFTGVLKMLRETAPCNSTKLGAAEAAEHTSGLESENTAICFPTPPAAGLIYDPFTSNPSTNEDCSFDFATCRSNIETALKAIGENIQASDTVPFQNGECPTSLNSADVKLGQNPRIDQGTTHRGSRDTELTGTSRRDLKRSRDTAEAEHSVFGESIQRYLESITGHSEGDCPCRPKRRMLESDSAHEHPDSQRSEPQPTTGDLVLQEMLTWPVDTQKASLSGMLHTSILDLLQRAHVDAGNCYAPDSSSSLSLVHTLSALQEQGWVLNSLVDSLVAMTIELDVCEILNLLQTKDCLKIVVNKGLNQLWSCSPHSDGTTFDPEEKPDGDVTP